MKKIFTLISVALMAMSVNAQDAEIFIPAMKTYTALEEATTANCKVLTRMVLLLPNHIRLTSSLLVCQHQMLKKERTATCWFLERTILMTIFLMRSQMAPLQQDLHIALTRKMFP